MTDGQKPIRVDVRQLGYAILYRWPVVVIPTLILPLVLWGVLQYLPKKYQVSAQILVQESVSVNPFLNDMSVPWKVHERLPVIQAILVSRATLESLLRHFGETAKDEPAEKLDEKVRNLRKQISVYGMGGGLIGISFTGTSPQRLYKGMVFLVDVLIEAMLRPQKQSLEDASDFLNKQITGVRSDLDKLGKKIEEFKKENAEKLPEVFQANLQSYMTTQTTLIDQQTELRAAQMRKKNLEQRLRVYNPIARELETKLIEARTKLSELQAVYTDDHPEILALKAHIQQLKKQRKSANLGSNGDLNIGVLESAAKMRTIEPRGNRATTGGAVENRVDDLFTSDLLEYKNLTSEVAALSGSVAELNQHGKDTLEAVKSFATTERKLQSLLRDFEVKQKTYKTLLTKAEEAKVTKALSMFDEDQQIVLIESPRLPNTPIGLTSKLNALVGLIAGLILGITAVVILEFMSGTIRNNDEVEKLTGLEVIGTMPMLLGKDGPIPKKHFRHHELGP